MFHLLVKFNGWAKSRDSIAQERVFEYTEESVAEQFRPKGKLSAERVTAIPALFISESQGSGSQQGRVGTITRTGLSGKEVNIEYSFDDSIPPIPNPALEKLAQDLDIQEFEFSRTHWAVKEGDLFKVLLRNQQEMLPRPKVFRLDNVHAIDETLLSVMMPFHSKFDDVYATIQTVAKTLKMVCLRADDIWENEAIIQDIVSLISRSRIVIVDCTNRNPNVFYEVGIAHALGRDVILVTQSEDDIPFDLRHLRHIQYLNNDEGRSALADRLKKRIAAFLKPQTL